MNVRFYHLPFYCSFVRVHNCVVLDRFLNFNAYRFFLIASKIVLIV
jgi:hypothetical protein